MQLISWNVNGIRAFWNHGLHRYLEECGADFICLQETKVHEQPSYTELNGYENHWAFRDRRRGYSGTVVFTRHRPMKVTRTLGDKDFDTEGRIITLEFEGFYLVNVYFPRPYDVGKRYEYRVEFDQHFRKYVLAMKAEKPVIICGDFNVPLAEEDIYIYIYIYI